MSADPGEPQTLRDGRYVLQDVLGDGGMATVYLAYDNELEVYIALKLLHPMEGGIRTSMVRRLRLEAKAMARLRHPNVLRMSDVFEEGPYTYVVMDLARGGSLAQLLDQHERLPPEMAVFYILQVLSALAAAHAEGIVHRDVKPHNVLLDERGHALLADFGIALIADRDRRTKQGVTMGSVAFMPPEQRLDAASVGPPADIHAVGATLYNLVTGDNPVDLFLAEQASDRWAGVPEPLRPVIAKACNVSPGARYATAGEMAKALAELAEGAGWEPWAPTPSHAEQFPAPSAAFSQQGASRPPAPRTTLWDLSTGFPDPATAPSRADSLAGELEVRPPTLLRPGDPPGVPETLPAAATTAPSATRIIVAAVLFAFLGASFVFSVAYLWSKWVVGAPDGTDVPVEAPAEVPVPEVVPKPAPEPPPEPAPEPVPEPAPTQVERPEVVPAPAPVAAAPRPEPARVVPEPAPSAVTLPPPAPGGAGQPYNGGWVGAYGQFGVDAVFGGPPDAVVGEVWSSWEQNRSGGPVSGSFADGALEVEGSGYRYVFRPAAGGLTGSVGPSGSPRTQPIRLARP